MTHIKFWLTGALAVLGTAISANPSFAQAPTPVVEGYRTLGFEGWTKLTEGIPETVSYVHRPDDRALSGAFVWFESVGVTSAETAFLASARTHRITNMRILARRNVERAPLLDSQGSGMTLIGEGTRYGVPVRMVAFVFYGSTTGTPRESGVHGFAAPVPVFQRLGGWTVPASLWMNLDPRRDVANTLAQGSASPEIQMLRFSGVANMWARWARNTMRGLAQGNIAALASARQTMVCAGDPQCRIFPAN